MYLPTRSTAGSLYFPFPLAASVTNSDLLKIQQYWWYIHIFKTHLVVRQRRSLRTPVLDKNTAHSAYSERSESQYFSSNPCTFKDVEFFWRVLNKWASGILYFMSMSSTYAERGEILMLRHFVRRWRLFHESHKLRYTEIYVTPNSACVQYAYIFPIRMLFNNAVSC